MNQSPQRRKIIWGAAALLGVAAVVVLWIWAARPEVPKEFAYGNGRMEATTVEIVPKFSGRIAQILGREGDRVKKGQLLVRLDTRDLNAEMRQAQAQVEERKQARNYAKAVIAQRESELLLAEQSLARSKSLYVTRDIPLRELQENESAQARAKAALAAARSDLTRAEASIQAAAARADTIGVKLEESDLPSPIDGRILYRSHEPGEVVSAQSSVLTVLDLMDVYMQFYLPTQQAGRVAIGEEARVVLDALPNRPIPARVTYVEPRSQFTPKQVETQSEREKLMFKIKVNIDPNLLRRHAIQVKTGLPGMAYVRLEKGAPWPSRLAVRGT